MKSWAWQAMLHWRVHTSNGIQNRNRRMRNRMYGGVRGRKTKVGEKLLRFPPTRLSSSGFFFIGFHGWIGWQSCLSDYSRISADIWPLANGSRPKWAPIVFLTQISQMTQIFSHWLFCPTDFTDFHWSSLAHSFFFFSFIIKNFFFRYLFKFQLVYKWFGQIE